MTKSRNFYLNLEPKETAGFLAMFSFIAFGAKMINYIVMHMLEIQPATDIDITHPVEYPYMILLRSSLLIIRCAWPFQVTSDLSLWSRIWIKLQTLVLILACYWSVFGNIVFISLHKKSMNFFELGHSYICLLMSSVATFRLHTLCFSEGYQDVTMDFIRKFHLFYYKGRSEHSMKIHKQVHRMSHIFTLYLTLEICFGCFLFIMTPVYNNYSAGKYSSAGLPPNTTYEHSLYLPYPWDASTDWNWYLVTNIINGVLAILCSSWFCVLDCLLSLMVFHMWGHFKILLDNLDTFPKPLTKMSFLSDDKTNTFTYEIYSPEELKNINIQLKECIDYHRDIIKFTNKMSEVFGPMLFVYYAFLQTSGCLLLLECSQMTAKALIRYLPLTVIAFQQLMQQSIIFELIGSISEQLKPSVYGLPWACMDTKNRKIVAIFLMNVQEPVHVKALGLADVGVTSMTTILKTSISYFTFLYSK